MRPMVRKTQERVGDQVRVGELQRMRQMPRAARAVPLVVRGECQPVGI